MKSIANELTDLRERAGLTQAECARVLGVHRQHWNRWERGHTVPLADRMAEIRDRLLAIAKRRAEKK